MKWVEISARPMDFKIDGEFRYSIKARDGYQYYFWNIQAGPVGEFSSDTTQYQYIISVYKTPEEMTTVGL